MTFHALTPWGGGDHSQVSGFHQSYTYSNFLTGHFSTPSTSTMSSKSTSSIYYFSTKNLFELAQGDQDAQPWQVQQVLLLFIKNWHGSCLQTIWSQGDPDWSRYSWTPSATSTSSIMGGTASTSYVNQKLTRHIFIHVLFLIDKFI